MSTPPRHVLNEMTWPEVKEALEDVQIALVPTGSVEQHGPNTTFFTDTGRAEGFCRLLAEKLYPRALAAPCRYRDYAAAAGADRGPLVTGTGGA